MGMQRDTFQHIQKMDFKNNSSWMSDPSFLVYILKEVAISALTSYIFYLFSLSWRGMRPEQRFWCGLTKLAGIREMSENWTKPMVDRPYQEILMPDTHKNGASHYRNLINLMYPT